MLSIIEKLKTAIFLDKGIFLELLWEIKQYEKESVRIQDLPPKMEDIYWENEKAYDFQENFVEVKRSIKNSLSLLDTAMVTGEDKFRQILLNNIKNDLVDIQSIYK